MTTAGPTSLGILLARGPGHPDAALALGLARVAAGRGLSVEIFLMAEGVDLLRNGSGELLPGVRTTVCTHSAVVRGAPLDLPWPDYASQHQLARCVARVDRFLSFC